MSKRPAIPKMNLSEDSDETAEEKTTEKKPPAVPVPVGPSAKGRNSDRLSTVQLVCNAIKIQNEKKGSSVQSIRKFIEAERGTSLNSVVLKKAFVKGLKDGLFVRMDSSETASLAGRYKLTKAPATKPKKPVKGKENDEEPTDKPKDAVPVKIKKPKAARKASSPGRDKEDNKQKEKKSVPEDSVPAKTVAAKKGPKKEPVSKKTSSSSAKTKSTGSRGRESSSDTELHKKSAKPKVPAAARRRSASESQVSQERAAQDTSGPSKKGRNTKGTTKSKPKPGATSKRAPRV